jgi:PAS domain S-box-containing protein
VEQLSATHGAGTGSFEALLHGIYYGTVLADERGSITEANSRAAELFLDSPEGMLGGNVVDLIMGASDDLLAAVQRNLDDHSYTLIEAMCARRDQSSFPAEIAVSRVEFAAGRSLCFLIRDMSVQKRAQEALEDAVVRLEAYDRSRMEFVSNVSHELRTPLTSMIYAVDNMRDGVVGALPDHAHQYLDMLASDCRRLLDTVTDILDIRRMETNSMQLHAQRAPMHQIVRRSVESLRAQAERRNVSLNVDAGKGCWFVDGDIQKLDRVVRNVVDNAIRFTPSEGRIDVTCADAPDASDHVLVSVTDTGIGIPADALAKVTERYFTVGEQASGSGLGLAIGKNIMELHGGGIAISSPPPGRSSGTRVDITLPLIAPPTVVAVGTDETRRGVLLDHITDYGYHVAFEDVSSGTAAISSREPGFVIVDGTPLLRQGMDMVLSVRHADGLKSVPVLLLLGTTLPPEDAEILAGLKVDTLAEPWKPSELREILDAGFLL